VLEEKSQDVPDLTTVLELYTLLIGGYQDQQRAPVVSSAREPTCNRQRSASETSHIPVDSSVTSSNGGKVMSLQHISLGVNGRTHSGGIPLQGAAMHSTTADSTTLMGSGVVAHSAHEHHSQFQPTLFAPFNVSGSETGIALAGISHGKTSGTTESVASAAVLRQSTSASGTAISGGQLSTGSFLQLQEFHLPKIVGGDNAQLELQLQLVEQVHLLLEVQQMLQDTLDYLVHVLRYHVDVTFPAVKICEA
jgi:hypothetical protein